jgi:hypothetical protein
MVSEGRGRLFRRKDDKYLIYLPKDLCEDSMFPFQVPKDDPSIKVKVTFSNRDKKIIIEEWKQP